MTPRKCPTCTTLAPVAQYDPFCSKRCADIDLQRWFAGAYTIPGEAGLSEPDAPEED